MTDRELMQQALDALEHHAEMTRPLVSTNETIKALRAALAQPEQELVAWVHDERGWVGLHSHLKCEWVGLTDEEINNLAAIKSGMPLYRAIEQALKEKNA